MEILSLLQVDGLVAKGFVAIHNAESDAFLIKNVAANEEAFIMRWVAGFEKRSHHFKIFPEGVEKGLDWIEEALEQSPDIAVFDEIGFVKNVLLYVFRW